MTNADISDFLRGSFVLRPEFAWVPTASDALAAFSYYLLALMVVRFVWVRKDLAPKKRVLFFAFFLFLAGSLHLCNVVAPWHPVYGLQSLVKSTAAVFSILTVLFFLRLIGRARVLPSPHKISELEDLLAAERESLSGALREKKNLQDQLAEQGRDLAAAKRETLREHEEKKRLESVVRKNSEEIGRLPAAFRAAAESSDFYSCLEAAAREICKISEFEYGEVWGVRPDGKVIECVSGWYASDRFKEFFEMSRELKFPQGMSLAGRVWMSGQPVWIEDISRASSADFFRAEKASAAGFHSGFAVPVLIDGKTSAVLIFFTCADSGSKGAFFRGWATAFCDHLGVIIQKHAFAKRLEDADEITEKKVRERTAELEKLSLELRQEMTEARKVEEAVRKSQENFETLVNSIEGIVWEYDIRSSRFVFVSQQTEKILGYAAEIWLSDPAFWQDHIHGGDRENVLRFRAEVARTQRAATAEYRMITAEGQTLWIRDMVTVVSNNGDVNKLRGVMVDITDAKQGEEALSQERNFVSTVLDTASAMVIILDKEGRVERFNRACEHITGYSSAEVVNKPFWTLFSEQEAQKVKKIITCLLAGQFPINYESSWVSKTGSQQVIAWSSTVLLNKSGHVVHMVATGIDITKRKEIEQKLQEVVKDLARSNSDLDRFARELQEANERLKKLDELKSHFISAASHELKTPLTSVKGYVEMVLNGEAGFVNDEQKEYLGYVKESTDRLHRLVRELLDISKIESGQAKMKRDHVDLRILIKEEAALFKAQAQEKGISLVTSIDPALNMIYCDEDKIKEVFDNLLSNAIKYTRPEGKITVFGRNHEKGVQVGVQDTGIGIRKEDQMRIFDPFQNIEKSGGSEKEESTGLGLTLVKRIVEAHSGKITVQSEENKGAVFTVILPPDMENRNVQELAGA